MPRVSIIITTHERPRLLPRAIESARRAGRDLEVVVVDDASRDETSEICRSLPDIRYVRLDSNRGVAGARNAGLEASTGEFVSFLDDDDERLPGSLDQQVLRLDASPRAGLIYGQARLVDERGAKLGVYPQSCPEGDVFWELLEQNFIPSGSAVFRRSCLERIGLLEEAVPGIDDWDFWIRVAERFEVLAVEQPVFKWRRSSPGSGQGSSRAARMIRMSVQQFRTRWMSLERAASATKAERRRAWRAFSGGRARHLVWETGRALAVGRAGQAVENLSTAVRLLPFALLRMPFDWRRARAVCRRLRGLS